MQTLCMTDEEAFSSLSAWNGTATCFIGSNGYADFTFQFKALAPTRITYGNTFLDFDHDTKPENSFADAQRVCQYLRSEGIAHWVAYSGAKGYHVHIVHKRKDFRFGYDDGTADALKSMVMQVQRHLKDALGLPTMDEASMGDPKKLCRVPFTRHVNRNGHANGRHCYLLNTEEMDDLTHDKIVEGSYDPEFKMPRIKGDLLTLPELVERLDIELAPLTQAQIQPIVPGTLLSDDGSTKRYLAALDLRCPGITNELKRTNPKHRARVYAALFGKTLGMTPQEFESVWVDIGSSVGFVDLHNNENRLYHIGTIYNNPRMAHFPNCWTLKSNGCCIGDACPKFKEIDWKPRKVKRRWKKSPPESTD